MSIANGTTHYNYPQVQLTDRPTFADFNEAFSDIDSKLYGLITGAATDEGDIAQLKLDVSANTTAIGQVRETANTANGKADTNAEAITLLQTGLGNTNREVANKLYSVAIAEPYDATSGTYNVGDIVVYLGQRYKCTTAVAVAEPFDADKWTGEDVETVLEHLQDEIDNIPTPSGVTASDVTITPIAGMAATQTQEALEELKSGLAKEFEKNVTGVYTYAVKSNDTVILEIGLSNATITGATTILTLDSDVRPTANKSVLGIIEVITGGVGSVQTATFTIGTDGSVQCSGNVTNGYGQIIAIYKTA